MRRAVAALLRLVNGKALIHRGVRLVTAHPSSVVAAGNHHGDRITACPAKWAIAGESPGNAPVFRALCVSGRFRGWTLRHQIVASAETVFWIKGFGRAAATMIRTR